MACKRDRDDDDDEAPLVLPLVCIAEQCMRDTFLHAMREVHINTMRSTLAAATVAYEPLVLRPEVLDQADKTTTAAINRAMSLNVAGCEWTGINVDKLAMFNAPGAPPRSMWDLSQIRETFYSAHRFPGNADFMAGTKADALLYFTEASVDAWSLALASIAYTKTPAAAKRELGKRTCVPSL